jgi:hypothetical protein
MKNRADREQEWQEMRELLLRTGAVEIKDADMDCRAMKKSIEGSIKGSEGSTLPSHEPNMNDSVQGECSIRTRAKTE